MARAHAFSRSRSGVRLVRAFGLMLLLAPGLARGQSDEADGAKFQCADAYERAQRDRLAGRLREARSAALFCAQGICPDALRGDCVLWSRELERSIPTVVLDARDAAGQPVTGARVYVDGSLAVGALDGRAFELDPGRHSFRLIAADGTTVERTELILEGKKNQFVTLALEDPMAAHASGPEVESESGLPVATYALGTASLLAFGGFAVFGLRGLDERSRLADQCEPHCEQSDLEPMRRDFLVADLLLGLGALTGTLAVYFALTDDTASPEQTARARLELRPAPGGASATLRF